MRSSFFSYDVHDQQAQVVGTISNARYYSNSINDIYQNKKIITIKMAVPRCTRIENVHLGRRGTAIFPALNHLLACISPRLTTYLLACISPRLTTYLLACISRAWLLAYWLICSTQRHSLICC